MAHIAVLDQPTFKWTHLKVEKLICFQKIEQLSASAWTRVALAPAAPAPALCFSRYSLLETAREKKGRPS
jgi:hypothetical protein